MAGYKMLPRGSGPTSRNRYKKLHFSNPSHLIPFISTKEVLPVNLSIARFETMKLVFRLALLCIAVAFVAAEDAQVQERPKTFRRLIPADVLRGELTQLNLRVNFLFRDLRSIFIVDSYFKTVLSNVLRR